MIKQELELGADLGRLRIILNFEKAALAAFKKCFPPECIEGCGFHLQQAWNRRALSLGLKNEMKDPRVRRWWMTIKGLMFLPSHLHRKVPAFHQPTIPRDHPAYEKCRKFLIYLHKNWYEGPFAGIWCKWDKKELRTSNIAESYHRVLRALVKDKCAPVKKTLMCIKGNEHRAMCTLRNLEKGIVRRLRKKDVERRQKIDRCMEEYRAPLHRAFVRTVDINSYCVKMARYTSDKVI